MKQYIKKIINRFGYNINKRITYSENELLLLGYSIPFGDVEVDSAGFIYLKKLNLKIDIKNTQFILQGYTYLNLLSQTVNATFDILEDGKIIVKINDHKVYINTWEEILILKEIYIDGTYNFNIGNNTDSIFIDIGMNVGFTSLFFAQKEEISKVYSFEPFPSTYKMALNNFSLNVDLSSKITAYNWGLGESNRSEVWDYNADYKGSMGMAGLPVHIHLDSFKNEKIKVVIKDVSTELDRIIEENNEKEIILKIDCEGAEYEIVKKLFSTNLLNRFTCIMIEWHVKGPKELVNLLESNGYYIFSFNECDCTIGMIYAIKK